MKILICGASGFIGKNLFEHYSRKGYQTRGTFFRNEPEAFNPFLLRADLRDRAASLKLTRGMDIVINASALTDGIGVFSKAGNAEAYAEANNLINANLAEAVYLNNIRHYIFLSCTVMYTSGSVPLSEEQVDPEKIHTKYLIPARMKLFAEGKCREFSALGSTKYTVIRHTNIYGPHDKFDLVKGHVLSASIVKVFSGKDEIIVWGNGKESRDFLHINDQMDFIDRAIKYQKNRYEIFNVGSGETYSVNELVREIIACSGKKIRITHDLSKPTVETLMNINVDKAKNTLGWKARIGLKKGLRQTINWYLKNYPCQ